MQVSPQKRLEILDALRKGTVPRSSLDTFAVGIEHLAPVLCEELKSVAMGRGAFKAIRGEYGCGKTFLARWLAEQARQMGFATSEVQISETETPLHRLETVYRRLTERLSTGDSKSGALQGILESWFYTVEEDVLAEGRVTAQDEAGLISQTNELLEQRLSQVTASSPMFAAAVRGYRKASIAGEKAVAEGLLAWLGGQPNVSASVKKHAGLKGDLDHFGALTFLQGLLVVLRDSGKPGLLLVLDEVETIQRVRSDARDKSLNALRQLIDEVDSGRFPGLYLAITGTPAFFDGPQGIQRLEPLAQRLHVDFQTNARFDNPRAVQIRLSAFDIQRLQLVGIRVRDIFAQHSKAAERIRKLCGDEYIRELAEAVSGQLGVGVAPRIFLKKLVADVLDRVELHADFDPRQHYKLTILESELSRVERESKSGSGVDDIELDP